MTIAADNRFARLRCSKLRADDMYDATVLAVEPQQVDPEFVAIFLHLPYLIGGAFADCCEIPGIFNRRRRRRVIHCRQSQVRTAHRQTFLL